MLQSDVSFLGPVDAKNFAFAFRVASQVLTGKAAPISVSGFSMDIGSLGVNPEIKNAFESLAQTGHVTFDEERNVSLDDSLYVRMMGTVAEALEVCYPFDSLEDMIGRMAVQARLTATLSLLQIEVPAQRKDDGTFFLDTPVVYALSNAPLDPQTGDFDLPQFRKFLDTVEIPTALRGLVIELPSEWITGVIRCQL